MKAFMKDYVVILEITVSVDNKEQAIERFWNVIDEDHRLLSLDVKNVKNSKEGG
jgi:hypothetical protein